MLNIDVESGRFVRRDESLYTVYVLDYGDNYHRDENEPTSEFEKEVRNIKARYKDISKYRHAMILYRQYIAYLEDKYGGPELFKAMRKGGMVNEYVPPKPRIKKTKELRFLKKHKVVLSSVNTRDFIDYEKMLEVAEFYTPESVDDIEIDKVRDKTAEKLSDDIGTVHLKSQSFDSDAEYLESFFKNKNYSSKKNKKKKGKKGKKNSHGIIISNYLKPNYQDYIDDDTYMEDSDNTPYTVYNGMILSTGTSKELDVYHTLNELGWNSYKLMKQASYSTRVTTMFKPPKKGKKKKKKKAESAIDGMIIDILNDSGYGGDADSFAEFQKEMLNMTSKNVFK